MDFSESNFLFTIFLQQNVTISGLWKEKLQKMSPVNDYYKNLQGISNHNSNSNLNNNQATMLLSRVGALSV